jgi:hypothetical protein
MSSDFKRFLTYLSSVLHFTLVSGAQILSLLMMNNLGGEFGLFAVIFSPLLFVLVGLLILSVILPAYLLKWVPVIEKTTSLKTSTWLYGIGIIVGWLFTTDPFDILELLVMDTLMLMIVLGLWAVAVFIYYFTSKHIITSKRMV